MYSDVRPYVATCSCGKTAKNMTAIQMLDGGWRMKVPEELAASEHGGHTMLFELGPGLRLTARD